MSRLLKQMIYKGIKKAQGSEFHEILAFMQQSQFKPYEQLIDHQSEQIEQLLRDAYTYVPFYQKKLSEWGYSITKPFDIFKHWQDLPPLTRSEVLEHQQELIHQHADKRGMFLSGTGGSTASPVYIAHDNVAKDWIQATYFFVNQWAGLTFGEPYFLLWASAFDLDPQRNSLIKRILMGYLQGRRILDTAVVNDAIHQEHIRQINTETDCHYMIAYANEAYALACYSLENNLPIERPLKTVFTTAGTLSDKMRRIIEEAFHCKALNRYGSREAGDIACECLYQRGLHLNPMNLKIEVVDDDYQPLPDGEEGRILLTSLHNYSMPLIRYDIGDRGILNSHSPCICGRDWVRIERLTGRVFEKIMLPGGAAFNGIFLEEVFDKVPNLRKYQVLQRSLGHLEIRLRSKVPQFVEVYAQQLGEVRKLLQSWTKASLKIDFVQTDDFERTLSGKELTIVPPSPSQPTEDNTPSHSSVLSR